MPTDPQRTPIDLTKIGDDLQYLAQYPEAVEWLQAIAQFARLCRQMIEATQSPPKE